MYKKINKLIKQYATRDPFKLAKLLDINIYYSDRLKSLLGMYTIQNRVKFVFLNSNIDLVIQKLVLAHEIGHAILHSKLLKQDLFSPSTLGLNQKFISQTENEANLFAALLLVDLREFIEVLNTYTTTETIAQHLEIHPNLVYYLLKYLKQHMTDIDQIADLTLDQLTTNTLFWQTYIK